MNYQKTGYITSFAILTTITLLAFQNCGQVDFAQSTSDGLNRITDVIDGVDETQFEAKTQNISVDSQDARIDILFVIDNSGSMVNFQNNMKERIHGFMSKIANLDYHIAVTSTDPNRNTRDANSNSVPWGDGQFRPFEFDNDKWYILKPGDFQSLSDADDTLGKAIQMGRRGNGDERGVNATYRVIEQSLDNSGPHSDFLRMDAALSVVLISDEDECSDGSCLSKSKKSRPDELLKLVDVSLGENKIFSFNSILHPPGGCSDSHNAATRGYVYEELSERTGGIIGDVCAADYTSQLADIGSQTESLVRSVRLSCVPQDANDDGEVDIIVFDSKGPINRSFTLSADRIVFDIPLTEGDYSIGYFCIK